MPKLCTGHGTPVFGCGETYDQALDVCPHCEIKSVTVTKNETKSCFDYDVSFGVFSYIAMNPKKFSL